MSNDKKTTMRGPGSRNRTGEKAKDTKKTLKRLLKYLRNDTLKLIITFILVIISSLSSVVATLLLQPAIDDFIIPGDFKGLLNIVISFIVIAIIGALATFVQNKIMIKIAQTTSRNLRKDVFDKLVLLPIKFYDTHSHGELMSRITNDLQNITDTLGGSIIQIFSSALTFVGVLISMLIISPLLTLIAIVALPIIIIITGKIARLNRKQFVKQQESLGKLNGFIEEHISGQYVVKAFCMEEENVSEFKNINSEYKINGIKAEIYAGIVMPLMRNLNGIAYAIIVIVAGILGVSGKISIGAFTTFTNFARQFGQPINEITNQFSSMQLGLASAERCFEIIDDEIETISDANEVTFDISKVQGKVKFENVSFSYEKEKPVLKNININVEPGQMVALVGPTGAGKTTIINLLTRFYDVDSGKILIDGIDIRKVNRESLRSLLGIVLQDTVLFSETVKQNILYGRLDANMEDVERVSKMARADEFIERLSKGYETEINEDGGNLSVGQKQLLNIARVFLSEPKILILDEATSNVDTRTELAIQEAMKELMRGRTSFVIAHRLSTIRKADKILVMDNGEIVESGTHNELISKEGMYYKLYTGMIE